MSEFFPKLTRALIEEAEKNGALLGRNPDGGKIIDYVGHCGGYWGQKSEKAVSRLLYVEEPPISQPNRGARKVDKGATHGSGRWQRLRMARASFHPEEARFVYEGLCRTHGPAWAKAFTANELVQMSFVEFLGRISEAGLAFPPDVLPPPVGLQTLALDPSTPKLSLKVVDPAATRGGGSRNSRTRHLRPILEKRVHRPEEEFFLNLQGISTDCSVLLLSLSFDELGDVGDEQGFQVFPMKQSTGVAGNLTVKDQDGEPFVFFDNPGAFAFMAIAYPEDVSFENAFRLDPAYDRWTAVEGRRLVARLREMLAHADHGIQIGWYEFSI